MYNVNYTLYILQCLRQDAMNIHILHSNPPEGYIKIQSHMNG